MIFKAKLNLNKLIANTLDSIELYNKPQRAFITEIMTLFMSIKGRMNFYQFGRFGKFKEQRYRQQFDKYFDFSNFNKKLIKTYCSDKIAIAFDPSYISKSGKKTYGVGKFWSGVAGHAKFGLEISGVAAIDIESNTAMHINAVQTPSQKELKIKDMSLLDWYGHVLSQMKDILLPISNIVVADAYFSKKPFADKMHEIGMFLISRFRNDADLKYLYHGKPTGKRGRPKKFNGKIDLNNIDQYYFDLILEDVDSVIYSAVVYSVGLKRNIRLVYKKLKSNKKRQYLLYFSTDIELDAIEILKYYKNRFQIEFLYRDGKQHTGLDDCQARNKNKLNFHFNTSLTVINLAKVQHWFSIPKEVRGAFSMADIKTLYHNTLMLERFIKVFAVAPNKLKNKKLIRELVNFGKIAA